MATPSIWCQMYIATFLYMPTLIAANNVAHSHVTYVLEPSAGSYFGYSILAHSSPKSGVSLWVGAPKYSTPTTNGVESTAKHGMIYRCPLAGDTECTSINVGKKLEAGKNSTDIHSELPSLALEACDFQKGLCGFYQREDSDFAWVRTNSSGLTSTRNKRTGKRICLNFHSRKSFLRITGPASYSVNDYYLNADSINANPTKTGQNYAKTILVSPLIKSTTGVSQCLRFCFNAFSHVTTRRILKVWMTYNETLTPTIRRAQVGKEFRLFTFDGLKDVASPLWNYTEEDITGKYDGYYRLYFEARVFYNDVRPAPEKCGASGDVIITDIVVANLACQDEKTDVDEVETEQSLGLSLTARETTKDSNLIQIATCAPLWQHNCGYAREANGVCYELEANQTHVQTVYSHNPISRECIRGKIDVVILVDQSGSVNQCNFQKVKGWLRNIIRSFNFGPSEQDIGVVVYSTPSLTKSVVNLGFKAYDNNGLEKKQQMLKVLTNLPYEAGKTYTGLALKTANDMLAGPNARPDAKKMIILLTDGATTKDNTKQLGEEVKRARATNATVLAVGVGKFNPKELIDIAGSKKNFFAVKKFSELEKVRDNLRGSVSSGSLEGASTNMTSHDLQQCQLGFSAYYSKDSLRMGSPGCYSLGGNVISHEQHDHIQESPTISNPTEFTTFQPQTAPMPFTEADNSSYVIFDSVTTHFPPKTKDAVTSSHEESTSQFGDYEVPSLKDIRTSIFGNVPNSYFGYATTGGFYFGEEMGEFIASSAPRHQGNGSVLIFHSLGRKGAAQRHLVIGLQYGEYFGATLCSEDFNNDGYTDLVVGAPLHSSRYSDEGRAYIYMGGDKMSILPDIILHGGKSRFGRFGKSISAVGDLNADGYQDLAVSAPLENSGVVYIYHGSRAGVITTDVQRLEPHILRPQPLVPPMNFGETVEGKVDVDGNGYPDLIIGAPATGTVAVMLTRPVVNVNLTILTSEVIDSRSEDCMDTGPNSAFNSCFNCSVCFLYYGRSLPTEILLQFNMYADVLQEKSRVSFTSTGQDHVTGSMKFLSQNKFHCRDYSLRMKPKVRDFMNPITLGLHYHLDDRFMPEPQRNDTTTTASPLEDSTLSSSGDYEYEGEEESKRRKRNADTKEELYPILNMYNHKHYETAVPFKTFCRNISQCIADIKLTTLTINKIGTPISSIMVGRDRIIRIRAKVINIGPEDAHDTRVTIIYSNKLYFNVLKKISDKVSLWTTGHTCGGSLVSPNWVVFAAHCTVPYPNAEDWTIYAGSSTVNTMRSHGQMARATDIVVNSLFTTQTYDSDVALLRLDRELVINDFVRTICLPPTNMFVPNGTLCEISGWGSKHEGEALPNTLQAASVRIIDRDQCNQDNWLMGLVNHHMICAGTVDGSQDACQVEPCFESDGTPEIYDSERRIFSFKLRAYILMKDASCEMDILFGTTYLLDPYSDGSAEFDVSTSTLSLDENATNSNQQVVVDLTYTAPLTFTGVSWPNVATVQTNESYFPAGLDQLQNTSQLVEQVFVISNLGNMELRGMTLNVKWPANVLIDDQIYDAFYIKNITCSGRMAQCSCGGGNMVDKYRMFSNKSSQPPLKIPNSPITLQSFVDCGETCATNFQCDIDFIKGYGSVQVTVVALPYSNTFSTLQSSILVKSTGTLQIKEKGFISFDFRKGGPTTNIETKVIPLKQFEFSGLETGFVFPLWAYILSAVVGLLMLLLLIFILKMCGFFKSKYGEKKRAAEEEREWGEAAIPLKQ